MKKILLFLALICSMGAFAQMDRVEDPHLAFKGVPINGTLQEYVQKMKQKGFDYVGTEDGIAILTGDFAGYKGCTVGVSTLKQKDLVSKIIVLFPDKNTWSGLSNDYFNLKDMLTEKYGKPAYVTEEFQERPEPRDDNSRMYSVQFDRCKYITSFETPKGDIELSIAHGGVSKCFVKLLYIDKINGDIIRSEAMDDL